MTTLTEQNLRGIAQELRPNDPTMVIHIFDMYQTGGMEAVEAYIKFFTSLQPRRTTIMEKVEDSAERFFEWLKSFQIKVDGWGIFKGVVEEAPTEMNISVKCNRCGSMADFNYEYRSEPK